MLVPLMAPVTDMTVADKIKRETYRLLWDGEQDKARDLILERLNQLDKERAELAEMLPGSVTVTAPVVMGDDGQLSMLDKVWDEDALQERRTLVLDLADKQAAELGVPISVAKIKAELDKQGFEMGVQENRKTTAIAGILRHSGRYEKVTKGKFSPVSS